MSSAEIVLLETIHADAVDILEQAHSVVLVDDPRSFDPAHFPQARALVTRGGAQVGADVIDALPNLEVVARCGVGLDNIDTEAAARKGVAIVHTPGRLADAVAEHALMLMLAVSRDLPELNAAVRAGDWSIRNDHLGSDLAGKRLGIVGFGAIGQRLAEIGEVLGMDVVCATRRTEGLPVERLELAELASTSDVIQLCLPLTPETHHMIDADILALLKPTAILVNTGRGPLVDHGALADALEEGRIAGYGTDVWDPEPPVANDRVLQHRRTVVTPHVAALNDETYRTICVLPAESVVEVLAGTPVTVATVLRQATTASPT